MGLNSSPNNTKQASTHKLSEYLPNESRCSGLSWNGVQSLLGVKTSSPKPSGLPSNLVFTLNLVLFLHCVILVSQTHLAILGKEAGWEGRRHILSPGTPGWPWVIHSPVHTCPLHPFISVGDSETHVWNLSNKIINQPVPPTPPRGTMEGKVGPRASPEEGLQTYRWLNGQMSKSGHGRSSWAQLHPGPRAEHSVVLDGEFVLGGLFNALKQVEFPLPYSLCLLTERHLWGPPCKNTDLFQRQVR